MSTWKTGEVSRWLNFVQRCILPPSCVLCGGAGLPTMDLCGNCLESLPTIEHPCFRCGLPLPPGAHTGRCGPCLQDDHPITRTVAALAYEDPISTLIGGFKYQRKLHMGRMLTQLLAEKIRSEYHGALPQLLIPVPLHDQRLRERGYNQAQLIAADLCKSLRIPLARQMLHRTRATPAQQGLRAHERKRNLRGAFVATHEWKTSPYANVALIDDVVTTMSTVREVANVLRHGRAGPLEVHVWCIARA